MSNLNSKNKKSVKQSSITSKPQTSSAVATHHMHQRSPPQRTSPPPPPPPPVIRPKSSSKINSVTPSTSKSSGKLKIRNISTILKQCEESIKQSIHERNRTLILQHKLDDFLNEYRLANVYENKEKNIQTAYEVYRGSMQDLLADHKPIESIELTEVKQKSSSSSKMKRKKLRKKSLKITDVRNNNNNNNNPSDDVNSVETSKATSLPIIKKFIKKNISNIKQKKISSLVNVDQQQSRTCDGSTKVMAGSMTASTVTPVTTPLATEKKKILNKSIKMNKIQVTSSSLVAKPQYLYSIPNHQRKSIKKNQTSVNSPGGSGGGGGGGGVGGTDTVTVVKRPTTSVV